MAQDVKDRIARVIRDGIDGCETFLETEPSGRITGHVVATEFEGVTYEARRNKIRSVIDQAVAASELSADDAGKVSTLLTYTPEEWSVTLPDD